MLRLLDIGIPRTGTVYRESNISCGHSTFIHERKHYNFTGREKVGCLTKVGDIYEKTFTEKDINDEFYRDSLIYFVYRNPFDLLVSCWAFLKRKDVQVHHFDANLKGTTFKQYLDIVINRETKYPNRDMLYWQCFDPLGKFIPAFAIDYDNLDEGLKELADIGDFVYTKKEPENTSIHNDYMQYFTEEMKVKIRQVYARDFSLLDDYDVIRLPR